MGQLSLSEEEQKKKEACFSSRGVSSANPRRLSGYSGVLDALHSLEDWRLEWGRLEAVRLSYSHSRVLTSGEILETVKQIPWKSF